MYLSSASRRLSDETLSSVESTRYTHSISVILLSLIFAKQRIGLFLVVEEHNPSEWSPCSSESVPASECISRHKEASCFFHNGLFVVDTIIRLSPMQDRARSVW